MDPYHLKNSLGLQNVVDLNKETSLSLNLFQAETKDTKTFRGEITCFLMLPFEF